MFIKSSAWHLTRVLGCVCLSQCYLEGEHALQEQYLQTISGPVLALDFAPALAVVRQDGQRAFKTVAVLKNPIGQISGMLLMSLPEHL